MVLRKDFCRFCRFRDLMKDFRDLGRKMGVERDLGIRVLGLEGLRV